MRSVHPWSLVAGLCLIAAAIFWWRARADAAFVAAALGIVAWFWNLRGQFKRTRDGGAGGEFEDVDERGREVDESERVDDVDEI